MIKLNDVHSNLNFQYENVDILDLITSESVPKINCQQSEFRIGCPKCQLSCIDIKTYLKCKVDDLKLQIFNDYESHFKKQCFNCSSSFHGSFEDGHFNLQKIFEVDKECKSCQRNFTTERSFYHNCNICTLSYNSCKSLVNHRIREHLCNKTFINQSLLNRHKTVHTEKSFQCEYCCKKYKLKCDLDAHLLEHGRVYKSFQCNYCSKQFEVKQNLDLHLFLHTGGNKFKSELCNKTFATQNLLNRHMNIHIEKPVQMEIYQCKFCPNQFKTKHSLEIHCFEHTGGKQFKCDVCDKTFARQSVLNQHKSVHGEESLQCEHCPKQYKSQRSLNIHLFEHNGGKQFKCDLCDKSFAKQYILNQHKFIHKEKSFQCTICSKFYKTPSAVRYHIKKVHKLQV